MPVSFSLRIKRLVHLKFFKSRFPMAIYSPELNCRYIITNKYFLVQGDLFLLPYLIPKCWKVWSASEQNWIMVIPEEV